MESVAGPQRLSDGDRVFLVRRKSGTAKLVIADSWSQDAGDGVLRFFDPRSRLVACIAISETNAIEMLTEGPVVWLDGQSVYDIPGHERNEVAELAADVDMVAVPG